MKEIVIDKGGFGLAPLFTKESTKDVLVESKGMDGYFLDELDIQYQVGDQITLKTPSKKFDNTFTIHQVEVYAVEENYKCKFKS